METIVIMVIRGKGDHAVNIALLDANRFSKHVTADLRIARASSISLTHQRACVPYKSTY